MNDVELFPKIGPLIFAGFLPKSVFSAQFCQVLSVTVSGETILEANDEFFVRGFVNMYGRQTK